ncbi:MAG: histidine phosphatase family protein [Bacteroidetes bacterium]|jgi:phosphohistidine phosphatase|nr:histidine phosphatase family protein [Bacteroidota bacterium]
MRVWVIRHAEAVHPAGRHDAERPLSPGGQAQAIRLGEYLSRRSGATLLLCSPLLRAQQTAEAIRRSMPTVTMQRADAFSTSGSAREAMEELRKLHVPECLIISHEPLTSQLVARLATGDDSVHVKFTPATAVLLDLGSHLRTGHAMIVECISPETLVHAERR